MTGISAAANAEDTTAADAVDAIEAVGEVLVPEAIDVASADDTVVVADTSVELSADAENGVVMTTDELSMEIGLPFAESADTADVIDGTLVYDNNNGSTTSPLVHEDGSVQIVTTISESAAPTAYAYELELAPGQRAELMADGSVVILDEDSSVVGMIAVPWAVDGVGEPVATAYELQGSTLIQHVDHIGAAYPVVADPTVSYGWWRYIWFNRAETKTIASGGWGTAVITGICTAAGGPIAGAACAAQFGTMVYTAGVAENSNPKRCLVVKFLYVSPVAISGTYRDSRCS